MSNRGLITAIISYVVIRLFYGISGFDPVRSFPGIAGYALDFAVWVLVYGVVYTALGMLGIYRRDRAKSL